jgi:hypothetical protein
MFYMSAAKRVGVAVIIIALLWGVSLCAMH